MANEEIVEAIQKGFQSVRNSSGFVGSGGTAASASGGSGISDMLGALGMFKELGGVGSLAVVGLQKLSNAAGEAVTNWQAASNSGFALSRDFIATEASIKATTLTAEQFDSVMNKTKISVTTLGGSLSESTEKFAKFSSMVAQTNLVDNFRELGFTTSDYNELLALTYGQVDKNNKDTVAQQAEAMKAARGLAIEMTAVTDLSGLSRQKQLDAMEAAQENESLQAQFDLLGADAKEKFFAVLPDIAATGMDKLGQAIVAQNGNLTAKQAEQLSYLGVAGEHFKTALLEYEHLSATASQSEKDAAKAKLEAANSEINAMTRSTEFRKKEAAAELFTDAGSGLGQFATQIGAANRVLNNNLTNLGKTFDEAIKDWKVAHPIDKEGNFINKPGTQDVSATVLEAQRAWKNTAIDVSQAIVRSAQEASNLLQKTSITSALRNTTGTGDNLKPGLTNPQVQMEAIDKLIKTSETTISQIYDKISTGFKENFPKTAAFASVAVDKIEFLGKEAYESIKHQLGFADGTPGVNNFLSGSGSLQGMFENFGQGTGATLHGMEAVMRPDQLQGILSKVQSAMPNPEEIANILSKQANIAMPEIQQSTKQMQVSLASESNEALNDINKHLISLNRVMEQQLREIADTLHKQYGVTKSMSPDILAR